MLCLHAQGCEKTFKTLPGLKYHMARHRDTNPNKFQCPVCKQVLKGVKRFENHIKGKHPNEDPELMVSLPVHMYYIYSCCLGKFSHLTQQRKLIRVKQSHHYMYIWTEIFSRRKILLASWT